MRKNIFKALDLVPMGALTRELLSYEAGENGYTVIRLVGKKGPGATLHTHPHLQFVYILKGKLALQVGEEKAWLEPGDTVQIESGVPHGVVEFAEDSEWLEFFTPEREDFKA